jgi:uncharacterized protein YicC (UPF0701 family)
VVVLVSELLQKEEGPDFLEARLQGMEQLLNELDMQIDTRLKESEKRLAEIARQVSLLETQMQFIPSGDPAIVNSVRSRLFAAINGLQREARNERIQALKDVSQLRIERQKLAIEVDARRLLFPSLG